LVATGGNFPPRQPLLEDKKYYGRKRTIEDMWKYPRREVSPEE
jgi:hypothetical protein